VHGQDAFGQSTHFTGTVQSVSTVTSAKRGAKTGDEMLAVSVKRQGEGSLPRTDVVYVPTGNKAKTARTRREEANTPGIQAAIANRRAELEQEVNEVNPPVKRGRGRPRIRPTADSLEARARDAYEAGDEEAAARFQREADKIRTEDERTVAQKLASLSDDQLGTLMERVISSDDPSPRAIEALAAEEDRRTGGGILDKDLAREINTDRVLKAEIARIRKESRMAGTARRRLDAQRQREDWEAHQEARMIQAEEVTRGHMFNKDALGRYANRPHLDRDLFHGKLNAATMRSIVSPEMAEWFGKHGWPVPYRIATADQATRNRHSDRRGQLGEWG
jgi:hypothetical protein